MEVSGQLHTPTTIPLGDRDPSTHCTGGGVGLRAGLDILTNRKNLLPDPTSN